MKISLQILQHQEDALLALSNVFDDILLHEPKKDVALYANPILDLSDGIALGNIRNIQKGILENVNAIPEVMRKAEVADGPLTLDIKMETGTGKTCVYTQLMYELNYQHGFTKFVIVVPTIAIREGTKNFIGSEYAKEYLRKYDNTKYGNTRLNLQVFEAVKQSKKGRKGFPTAVNDFFRSTGKNTISVLLIGQHMIKDSTSMGKECDMSLLDMYSHPYKAIAATNPIMIIDEPHKFKKEDSTYKYIINKLKPQVIFRFGATFPTKKAGKVEVKDYTNLVYNLDSCEAFNRSLIKGVAIEYLPNLDEKEVRIKVTDIKKAQSSSASYVKLKNENTGKIAQLSVGGSLAELSPLLNNLSITEIGKIDDYAKAVKLSNEQVVPESFTFYPSIYGESYQEKMLSLALDNHFETELINFRRESKIKTLALFFIDSISSYRGDENEGYLRKTFEVLLEKKLKKQLVKVEEIMHEDSAIIEYYKYLQASLKDISKTHAGYFSQDNDSSDEVIKAEINNILKNKESLLSFKDENGDNILRFIFSKWTLREGWDNPNVFTIAKLRSSGSEISKLQEVGRGLRLPVNEFGERISDESFYLNYIVDFSERDFADKLISEINSESIADLDMKKVITSIAKKKKQTYEEIANELQEKGYIDKNHKLISENLLSFSEEYTLPTGVQKPKIINKNKKESSTVKIRKGNFDKLKDLWQQLNTRYYIKFEDLPESALHTALILSLGKAFTVTNSIVSKRLTTAKGNDNKQKLIDGATHSYLVKKTIPYNEFLKSVQKAVNIPIQNLHQAILLYNETSEITDEDFTIDVMNAFIAACKDWQSKALCKYSYRKLDLPHRATKLTDIDGNVVDSIAKADVGVKQLSDLESAPSKFLYELPLCDSEIENRNIIDSENIDEIIVYGKIPKNSVKIPLYWGGSYSPDFMYAVKGKDGSINLNCIIETKGIDNNSSLREEEDRKIKSAEKFYEQLSKDCEGLNLKVHFRKQINNQNISEIIQSII